jgi:uncharacterized protein (DUF305 family)
MTTPNRSLARVAGALAVIAATAWAGGAPRAVAQVPPPSAPARRLPHSPADVAFMSGMIHHHAQAVLIAAWAPTHGASPALLRLCERVVVGQQDEIALMQRWLEDRGEPVPRVDSTHHGHHPADMPGMLSPEQLVQLDEARGPAFDRLFLTFMIQHHQGALVMVDRLFGTNGAAQDEVVFRMASDVYADQSTEIERMQRMLAALPPEGENP